jgi:hypothetical protein
MTGKIFLSLLAFGFTTILSFAQGISSFNTRSVPHYESKGREALASIRWNWKPLLPEWNIKFEEGRAGYLGLCDFEKHTIRIWIRPQHEPKDISRTIVHELAHAFDRKFLTAEMRNEWLAVRGIPNVHWNPECDGCSDYRYGSGDFAESVSWTLQGPGSFGSKLGAPPNKAQRALIRKWLERAIPPP